MGEARLVKLRYTPSALAELDEVFAYIEERSPQGAQHVKARIQAVINLLLQNPQAGQLTSKSQLRRVTVSPFPYHIFYQAAVDAIIIHAVRHASRKP